MSVLFIIHSCGDLDGLIVGVVANITDDVAGSVTEGDRFVLFFSERHCFDSFYDRIGHGKFCELFPGNPLTRAK
jgi:hypothetical protein